MSSIAPRRSPRVIGAIALALSAALLGATAAHADPTPTSGPTTGGTSVQVELPGWQRVFAGESASFALDPAGGLWAWGINDYGALGDGTTDTRTEPVPIAAGQRFVSVSTAWTHTLAVDEDGNLWAWGDNTYGQLGNGTTTASLTPIQITGFGGNAIAQVATGRYRSVVLDSAGTVWTWGRNQFGELGNGTTTSSSTPIAMPSTPGWYATDIQAGQSHTVALANNGTVWAWGSNGQGQLGDGTTVSRTLPVQVTGLAGRTIVDLSTGASNHTLAVDSTGTVWAWGFNGQGQLGDGTTTNRSTPVSVPALSGLTINALATSPSYSMALTDAGRVWTWGYNASGQLGDGSLTNRSTPAEVAALAGRTIVHISSGFGAYALAVDLDGIAWGWGYGDDGQFADGTFASQPTPVQAVPTTPAATTFGGQPVTGISAGSSGSRLFTVVTPSHPEGDVDVVVTSTFFNGAAGPSATYPDGFTYVASSGVTSPSGANGSATLAATGDEFTPGILVLGLGLGLAGLVLMMLSGSRARRRRRKSFVSRR